MSLQMIGDVKYSPTRDIVYMFPAMLQAAMEAAITKKPWPDLARWMAEHGIDDEELADGFAAYTILISTAPEFQGPTITSAMEASGWLDIRWEVRVAVGFYMVYIMTGAVYHGVRAAVDDEHSVPTMPGMIEAGRQLDEYVRMPWWKKWKFRWNRIPIPIAHVK
jgi:hypothetical protein